MIDQDCNIIRTLEELETLGDAGRHDLMVETSDQTNGYFKQANRSNNWDSQRVEIMAHGLFADGNDDKEAIRNWVSVALSSVRRRALDREQVLAAIPKIMRPENMPDDELLCACDTVLQHPQLSAMCHTDKARTLRAALLRKGA